MQSLSLSSLRLSSNIVHRQYQWMIAVLLGCLLPVSLLTPLFEQRTVGVHKPFAAVIIQSLNPIAQQNFRKYIRQHFHPLFLSYLTIDKKIFLQAFLIKVFNPDVLSRRGPPSAR